MRHRAGSYRGRSAERAYALMTDIHWDDCFCRKDIGWRAIEREQN
ncbi:hypothetical protein ACLK17_24995 [Escherichia coli]